MTVSKYPIEVSDEEGQVDAINYLLSGPSGLGQNFSGYSRYLPQYIRPSARQPWSLPITTTLDPSIYLDIPISNITPVGGNPSDLLLITFTTPFATAPFQFGDYIDIANVTESGVDTSIQGVDWFVYSCTANDVTVGYDSSFGSYTWNTYVSGGDVLRTYINKELSTDANGRVTVNGAGDRVFISAQIDMNYEYTCTTNVDYKIKAVISRGVGFPNTDPGQTDFFFTDFVTVSEKTIDKSATVGSGTENFEAIFASVLDGPNLNFNYYWYILSVYFLVPGSLRVVNNTTASFTVTGLKPNIATTTFTGLLPTNVTGTGTGLTLDITVDSTVLTNQPYRPGTNTTIDITAGGSGYNLGDILTIPGTSLGGASPANDMTLVIERIVPPYDVTIGKAETGLLSLTAQVVKQ